MASVRERATCSTEGCSRPHHARGLCAVHYRRARGYVSAPSTPEVNAEQVLRRGGTLSPPRSLPYRVLARSCEQCGAFITTPDRLIRKDSGALPRCHSCHIRAVRRVVVNRQKVDEEFRKKMRRRTDLARARQNSESLETATRSGQQWTGPELEIVGRADLTARQAAALLGRTLYSVKHARQKLTDPKWSAVAGIPRG